MLGGCSARGVSANDVTPAPASLGEAAASTPEGVAATADEQEAPHKIRIGLTHRSARHRHAGPR